jgi:hypothetical protein
LCAIDVTAFANATYVAALSTENLNVVICRFSRAHSKESADQGITRLDYLEKTCLAMNICAHKNGLLVGNLPADESNKEKLKTALKNISQFVLSARTTLQLANFATALKEKSMFWLY